MEGGVRGSGGGVEGGVWVSGGWSEGEWRVE